MKIDEETGEKQGSGEGLVQLAAKRGCLPQARSDFCCPVSRPGGSPLAGCCCLPFCLQSPEHLGQVIILSQP